MFAKPVSRELCLSVLAEFFGRAECPADGNEGYGAAVCRQMASYQKALTAKKPGLCDGGLCRVWMGEGAAACEPYAAKLKASACRRGADPLAGADRGQQLLQLVSKAQTYLAQVEAQIPIHLDGRRAKELDARAEKLARSMNAYKAILLASGNPAQKPAPVRP